MPKFLYLYPLVKNGDTSIKNRLDETPEDYRHITIDEKFKTRPDIVALFD